MTDATAAHAAKCEALVKRLQQGGGPVRLAKTTSNLFRDRPRRTHRTLDVHALDGVLSVDGAGGWVDTEGMATYEALTDACLAEGVMPAVVPQLKTITLGGAVAGVGIEASSHRYGLVHETVLELEVLTGDGRILVCTPHNAHADLYFGFPNSYGTLGYALRVKARTAPVKPYVHLEHVPFHSPEACFAEMDRQCRAGEADFIDGTAFAPDRLYLTLGRYVDRALHTSDYTYERIYYRSIAERRQDWLTVRDFIWRWDTDWFWCSRNALAQQPLIRRLYGRDRLGSRTYTRIMRWNSRIGFTRLLDRVRGLHAESVIQDVDVPLSAASDFFRFYQREIALWPMWLCPVCPQSEAPRFTLYPMRREPYVNFGFWDVLRTRLPHEPGHYVRKIERQVTALGGIKSLYSDSYFPEDEFRNIYGGNAYRTLKAKYDPQGVFDELYEKCVPHR